MSIIRITKTLFNKCFILLLLIKYSIEWCGPSKMANNSIDYETYTCEIAIEKDFNEIPSNVKIIFINESNIEELNHNLLSRFTNLSHFICNHSGLKFIHNHTFSSNLKLTVLNLDFNFLKKLQSTSFEGLNSLTNLSIINNEINCIEHDFFDNKLLNLENLMLSYNPIVCFNFYGLNNQKKLKKLDLYGLDNFECRNELQKYVHERKSLKLHDNWKKTTKDTVRPYSKNRIEL